MFQCEHLVLPSVRSGIGTEPGSFRVPGQESTRQVAVRPKATESSE
jgi:hypothetical protein